MFKISRITVDGQLKECITDRNPVISFAVESDRDNDALSVAVIQVGNWKRETADQINNVYDGKLSPFTRYLIQITAQNINGEKAYAETSFMTGHLGTPWQGKWITDLTYDFPDKESPVPMEFRHSFTVKNQKIRDAWINATALGIYELQINGKKVGEDYFAPGFTSYEHQIQYQTYHVTELLQKDNRITAVVAGGWAVGCFDMKRKNKISADRQALLCEIHVVYEDGSKQVIGTDENWEVTEDGCYRMAEWYDGETYDATIQVNQKGQYNQHQVHWKKAQVTQPRNTPKLLAQYGYPVRRQEILQPISVVMSPKGELIYDFGQNFAGVIAAQINGSRSQTITFRHAEVLVDGELFVKSLRTAKATATYICKDGEQEYSPRLTYMGFRYVGVRGIHENNIKLSAYVLHSELPKAGTFTCSNELLNQLQSNIRWGGKSNFVDIPTDCPQRDERLGWTGDIAVFARTATYNFDMSRFLDKWLLDMKAEQGTGGGIPFVIPKAANGWPAMASSCWGDSCILVPWAEYLARGNKQLLKRQYPVMKRFLKACEKWASLFSVGQHKYIWRWPYHWGDWCAPDAPIVTWFLRTKWVATSYFANSCNIFSQIASILGEEEDNVYYKKLFHKINKAYHHVFTDGKGKVKKEFQSAYVLPLAFGMTKGEETQNMVDNLHRMIHENGGHLATGFPGTPYILFALSDNGRPDLAYELLLKDTCPSWLYEVKAGGTTIWERWDALRPDGTVNIADLGSAKKNDEDSNGGMVSFNHYANGAVGDWLYRRCLGIEPIEAGYKSFQLKPIPGGNVTWAKGCVETPYGTIQAEWRMEKAHFYIQVEVPVSTKCQLTLPDGSERELGSGKYECACKL